MTKRARRKRVVVVQADARARASLRAPLAAGIVRWRGADERLALALKLTLAFRGDTVQVVAPEPVRGAIGEPEELERPTDFVFPRPRCDLMCVGHAHARPAAERVDVELTIGEVTRAFRAVAGAPSEIIPLTPAHLRGERDQPIAVGPRAVPREPPEAASTTHDHAAQQAAPPGLVVDPVAADASVTLRGLSPRAARCAFDLPGLAPRAFVEGVDGLVELPLVCDTFLLDGDYERIELVWRAMLPEGMVDVDRVVVSLERALEPRPLEAILGDLPRGTFTFAAEEDDRELAGDETDLEMASYEVLEHRAEPELTLGEFAAVSARLAEQDRPRGEILADLEISDRAWTIEERAWIEHMGDRASAGDGTLAAEFADLFLDAQDALKGPDEPRPMETYASLKVALERADKPKDVLDERGIAFGEWMRLERHYNDAAAEDPAIAAQLADLLAAARRA